MATKKKQTEPVIAKDRWLLPSNHYNLISWQSSGIVLSNHSMEKYYPDCTAMAPGWIPIFLNRVPQHAYDAATSRSGHFTLLDVDICKFSGRVYGVSAYRKVAP